MEPRTVPVSRKYLETAHLPHMVYELYNIKGEPIYVGHTIDIAQRLGSHRRQPWWREVAEIHTETLPTRDDARKVEAARIAELQPPWNFTHTEQASEAARQRWRRVKAAARA